MRRKISETDYYVLKQAIKSDAKKNSNSAVLSWIELNVPDDKEQYFYLGAIFGVIIGALGGFLL